MKLPHSERFAEAWADWLDYRQNERRNKVGPQAAKRQLKFLGQYPEDEAVAIIDKSIMCGWEGLFPLRDSDKPSPSLYV